MIRLFIICFNNLIRNDYISHSILIFFPVLDIPNEDYLESLEEANSIFSEYQSTTTDETKLASVIVHFSPQNIIETEIYQNFIDRFTPSTQHLVLNSTNRY